MHFLYFFLLSLTPTIHAAEELIQQKIIRHNTVCFHVCPTLTKKYIKQKLYLSYPSEINLASLPSSIVDIPLIANIIPVIWLSGQTYTIQEMDEDLYYSLLTIKEFFKRFFYNTSWDGELQPERLIKNHPLAITTQPAALWTGGLDSTTTALRHLDEKPLLISFNNPHKKAIAFAQQYDLQLSTITMNHHYFLNFTKLNKASIDISKWLWDTTMGLAWVGAAAPLLYAKGIPILYVPSGFTWQSFIFPDGQTLQQPACPLIDENLSPAGLYVVHDGFTMTRTDKMKFISTYCAERNHQKPALIVCNYHKKTDTSYTQCNRCFKCTITMLDIIAIGEDIKEYGFTLSNEEFILHFKTYIEKLTMRRGGTYVALRDTQNYIQRNKEYLPQAYQPFYDWLLNINLLTKINTQKKRPLRTVPFAWSDYQDLYTRARL